MNKINFKSLLALLLTVLMVFSIVPMSVSAEETTVTFDFSSLTGKGTEITSSNALSTFQSCASDDSYLTAVTTNKIYNGNGSSGLKPNTAGFIKTGTSSANGNLTMTFTKKVDKVELVCHAWTTSGNDTVSVNNSATQKAPTNGDITETLTFEIDASETVSIVTAKRTFIKSITVYLVDSTDNEGGETPEVPGTTDTPSTSTDGVTATQITSLNELVNGKYVIATTTNAAMTTYSGGTSPWILATSISPEDGKLSAVDSTMIWTITVDGTSVKLTDSNGVTVAPKGGDTNGIKSADYSWTVSCTDGSFQFAGVGTDTVVMASNKDSSNQFRGYRTSTVSNNTANYPSNFNLYKIDASEGGETPAPETPVVVPATLAEQIEAANALANGAYLPYESTITGTITDTPAASSYTEGAYKFTVSDGTNSVLCYYTPVTGGTPEKGDTVTVTGNLTAYNGSAQFDSTAAATITEKAEVEGGEEEDNTTEYATIADGTYVIVTDGKAMSNLAEDKTYGYPLAAEVTVTNGVANGYADTDLFTITNVDGGFTLQDSYGRYYYMTGTYNSFNVSAELPSEGHVWQAVVVDGGVQIVNVLKEKTLAYSTSYSSFGIYADQSSVFSVVVVSVEEPETPDVPEIPETTESENNAVTAPEAGVPYKFGMIQGNVDNKLFYLKGGMNGYYMDTADDYASAIDVYLEETEGGYYLYTMVDGVKTYINMVVSGTHVNGAYETTASTVYKWNAEKNTIVAEIDGADYWFGTRNDKTYTTVGPVKVEYDGFYCQFYTSDTVVEPEAPTVPATGDMMIVLVSAVLLAGAALTVISRKRRCN